MFNLTFSYPLGSEKGFLGKIKGFLEYSSSKLPHFPPAIPPMPTPPYLCHTALLAKRCRCSSLTAAEDKLTGQAVEETEIWCLDFTKLFQASSFRQRFTHCTRVKIKRLGAGLFTGSPITGFFQL